QRRGQNQQSFFHIQSPPVPYAIAWPRPNALLSSGFEMLPWPRTTSLAESSHPPRDPPLVPREQPCQSIQGGQMRLWVECWCVLATMLPLLPAQTRAVFDVKSFGAKGDGQAPDRDAINRAVEAAGAAGGGTVYFPAGTYLTGSLRL